MLFSLTKAIAIFMVLMSQVFRECLYKFIVVFIDDIVMHLNNAEEQ